MLAADRLAVLAQLRPAQQEIPAETLITWLQNAGNARLAAQRLHVHPQTVRYRLRQITSLFRPGLLDPDVRFDLEIALRVRRLLDRPGSQPQGGA